MKLAPILALAMFGLSLAISPSIQAEDEFLDTFSIGSPPKPTITPEMMAKSRSIAIKNANSLLHSSVDPMAGDPNASVTLVEFMDFKCPLSEKMDTDIQALLLTNPDFRIIYKVVPLRGSISVFAAKAALAANKQGKYVEFHKALMQAGQTLTSAKILEIAKAEGLNVAQLKTDMDNPEFAKQIEANKKLFQTIGIPGTPGLIFTKSNLTDTAKNNAIIYMLGVFTEVELQGAIEAVEKQS